MTWLIGRHCDLRCLCSSDRPTDRASLVFFSEDRRIKPTALYRQPPTRPPPANSRASPSIFLVGVWVGVWVGGWVRVCMRATCVRAFVRPCVRALVDAIKKARAERAYAERK